MEQLPKWYFLGKPFLGFFMGKVDEYVAWCPPAIAPAEGCDKSHGVWICVDLSCSTPGGHEVQSLADVTKDDVSTDPGTSYIIYTGQTEPYLMSGRPQGTNVSRHI